MERGFGLALQNAVPAFQHGSFFLGHGVFRKGIIRRFRWPGRQVDKADAQLIEKPLHKQIGAGAPQEVELPVGIQDQLIGLSQKQAVAVRIGDGVGVYPKALARGLKLIHGLSQFLNIGRIAHGRRVLDKHAGDGGISRGAADRAAQVLDIDRVVVHKEGEGRVRRRGGGNAAQFLDIQDFSAESRKTLPSAQAEALADAQLAQGLVKKRSGRRFRQAQLDGQFGAGPAMLKVVPSAQFEEIADGDSGADRLENEAPTPAGVRGKRQAAGPFGDNGQRPETKAEAPARGRAGWGVIHHADGSDVRRPV